MGHTRMAGISLGVFLLAGCAGHAARPVLVASPTQVEPLTVPAEPSTQVVVAKVETRPQIEVVFVLDTTGSMGGLIEGAKQKIWAIADELASAKPTPELRVGLVAYRDRGDQYVTQHYPLTDDLDLVYQQLYALRAEGGGDGPESVNQALHEAVAQTAWSAREQVYRAVFLVGDAPPHMDYADDVPYTATVAEAAQKQIVINTVQCGSEAETKAIWLAMAQAGQGSYAAIAQSGGMQQIAAPMDAEIERLNAQLSDTVVPYGRNEEQEKVRSKARMAGAAPAAASASRHAYLDKKGGEIITGGGDLVDDVKSGRTKLEAMKSEELPAELRSLSRAEQTVELERRGAQRAKIKAQLDQLVKERADYVRGEEGKRRARGEADGFDQEVMKAIKTQASKAGIAY
jgi:uncharacterized protein YegL